MQNKYPVSFQHSVLSLAMVDKDYLAVLAPNCKATYFESEALQWTYRLLTRLWSTGHTMLTDAIMDTELALLSPTERGQYGAVLWSLWTERGNQPADYIRVTTLDWLKRNLFVDGHRQAAELYNNDEFEQAVGIMLKASKTANDLIFRPPTGSIYMIRDWEKTYKEREQLHQERHYDIARTGIKQMDGALGGGLRTEEFSAVLGLPKTKKSITLDFFAVVNFRIGLPTLVIKLEGRRQQNVDRIESMILQTSYFDVRGNNIEYGLRQKRKAEAQLYEGMSELVLRTMTSEFRYTVLDIEEEIKALRATGIDPKLVIIDYCDLMYPADGEKYPTRYESQAQVFRETKVLAERNGVAVWTAIQAKRRKTKKSKTALLTEDEIADSYEKARVCDFIMSLNQVYDENDPDKELPFVDWFLPLCRDNPGSFKTRVFMDWDRMKISETDPATP